MRPLPPTACGQPKAIVTSGSRLLLLLTLVAALPAPGGGEPAVTPVRELNPYPRSFGPDLLSLEELLTLSQGAQTGLVLEARVDEILRTPFIDNGAYYDGVHPHIPDLARPSGGTLGPGIRVVTWNVNKGTRISELLPALRDPTALLAASADSGDGERGAAGAAETLLAQIEIARTVDVWILNEVDWGIRRSCYRNVAAELAAELNMNWAFGVEFVEIDPRIVGSEEGAGADPPHCGGAAGLDDNVTVGFHGTAVLSRYPIVDARLQPFQIQGYDWEESERGSLSPLEHGRRLTSRVLFGEPIGREIRRGGRTALVVTLGVAGLEEARLTIAAAHLEGRAHPDVRRVQMAELLASIRDVSNPVILAGDLNTSLGRQLPRSFTGEVVNRIGSPRFWAESGIKLLTGLGMIYDVSSRGAAWLLHHDDPTSTGVPIVAPNPEKGLFRELEAFRFADGAAFDFRGNKEKTVNGTARTLANSNLRDRVGFATTYKMDRSIGPIGKFKLDWILVKAYLRDPRDTDGPYRFAPHYPRVLHEVNRLGHGPISDHVPISVDLPFIEP